MGGFGEHAEPHISGPRVTGSGRNQPVEYFIYCGNPNCGERHYINPGFPWKEHTTRLCAKCGAYTLYDATKVMIKYPGRKPEPAAGEDKVQQDSMKTPTPSGSKPESKWPGYEELESVLNRAIDQAAFGKGKDRHSTTPTGDSIPFIQQKIITLGKLIGPESHVYQACKKATEGLQMRRNDDVTGRERCVTEMLGAIVYLAAAIYVIENP